MTKDLYDVDSPPPHPGEILREDVLPRLALPRAALAAHLGISRRRLAELLAERSPVTFDLAQRLGSALGTGARFWLGLQMQHDVWKASSTEPPRIKPIVSAMPPRDPQGARRAA